MNRPMQIGKRRPGLAHAAGLVALGAVLVAIAWVVEGTAAIARGWLLSFAAVSFVPLGSLVLLMIHHLTGGAWGFALAPVLRRAALCIPLVALAFVPLAIATHLVYPWSGGGFAAIGIYLNIPAFLARSAIALIGWSIIGIVFGRGGGTPLLAALGLAFYGFAISFIAVDWFLSVDPHYTSTAFGAMIAIEQILAALATAALLAPRTLRERDLNDLASFLIAALLGAVYLALMTFIVDWYGNLPDKAHWYLLRDQGAWVIAIDGCGFLALLSFAMLLLPRIRGSHRGMRLAGAAILMGIALHVSWLIVPALASQARVVTAAALCLVAIVLIAMPLVVRLPLTPEGSERHAS